MHGGVQSVQRILNDTDSAPTNFQISQVELQNRMTSQSIDSGVIPDDIMN
jgi:hypothetical protein